MPNRGSKDSSAGSVPATREERLLEFDKLLESVAEDFLAAKGLGYQTWERELPVNLGSSQHWTVIAIGGQRFGLSGEHLDVVRRMDDWVLTGKGENPAKKWFDEKRTATPLPEGKGKGPQLPQKR